METRERLSAALSGRAATPSRLRCRERGRGRPLQARRAGTARQVPLRKCALARPLLLVEVHEPHVVPSMAALALGSRQICQLSSQIA